MFTGGEGEVKQANETE